MATTGLSAEYTPIAERATSSSSAADITRKSNDVLDKNAFLLLLITQMQYQDPLNPVEDKEFIAQMAQFSALEQMQNLNATATNSQTFSLIGKYAAAQQYNSQTGEYKDIAGRVDAVVMRFNTPYLVIGENEVLVSDVTDVFEDEYSLNLTRAQATNAFAAQNIGLIGKFIQAITYDSEGKATGFVEGKVEYVKLVNGTPVLVVGNKDVYPTELIAVSDEAMLIGKNISISSANEDGNAVYNEEEILGIEISEDKPYLVTANSRIEIDTIDTLTEALKYIGKQAVTNDNETLDIVGVTIVDRVPYVVTSEGKTVPFSSIKR